MNDEHLEGVRRIYLAGPMTGYPEFNFPAFRSATAELRAAGFEVVSPAEMDEDEGLDVSGSDGDRADLSKPYAEYLAEDLAAVCRSDAVVVLDGWRESQGASIEVTVARGLGKPVLSYPNLSRVRDLVDPSETESVLEEASRLVDGDRQADYGHPIDDFTRTGQLWGALLGREPVPPAMVGLMMVALKLSRECNRPKRDNLTDAAGYVRTVEMVRERESA